MAFDAAIPSDGSAAPVGTAVSPARPADALLREVEALQAQLDQVRHGLAHAHRLATLGTVAAIVAHEFNNILTPTINYCQLALAKPDDADLMRKSVEKSLDGAERAARICAAILGFAQDEPIVGRTPVREIPLVVQDALECMAREPRKDGLKLELQLDSLREAEDGAAVAMNHVALQQVLVNLMLNARRAMGRHGGQLTVAGRMAGRQVEIRVSDTGPGVPPAVRARLFEPFVTERIDPDPRSLEPAGTGLGLSVCRDLVTQAGGTITLDDPIEGHTGATFRISLPLVD